MSIPTLRLFIAIALPPVVCDQIADVTARLKTGCRFADAHPKWVNTTNLHVTLIFLGDVAEERIPQLCQIMDRVAADIEPFDLALDGLSLFPLDSLDPKILASGIAGRLKALRNLHARLAGELQHIGVDIPDRPYRPHLTLARLTSIKTSSRLAPLAKAHTRMLNAKFDVTEIQLYQSEFAPTGSVYSVHHVAKLASQISLADEFMQGLL